MEKLLVCGLRISTAPIPDGRVVWSVDNHSLTLCRGYAADDAEADEKATRAAGRLLSVSLSQLVAK